MRSPAARRAWRLIWAGVAGAGLWAGFVGWRIATFPPGDAMEARGDVAIVLGASAPNGVPSAVFAARIDHAIELLDAGRVRRVMFTGGRGAGAMMPDAVAAKQYALAKGVREDLIWVETVSRTTRQNLAEARRVLGADAKAVCVVVSDAPHLFRAERMMRDEGLVGGVSAAPGSRIRSWRTKLPFILREVWFYHVYLLVGK